MLNAYIFALQYYDQILAKVAVEQVQERKGGISSIFFKLLSTRPNICSSAMEKYPSLLDLMVRLVYTAFEDINTQTKENMFGPDDVVIHLRKGDDSIPREVRLPSNLLQAAIVLISKWQGDKKSAVTKEFEILKSILIQADPNEGAASAVFASSKVKAVSTDEVSFILIE